MKSACKRTFAVMAILCAVNSAYATRYKDSLLPTGPIVVVGAGETTELSDLSIVEKQAKYRPYVKDGAGTLLINTSGTMNNALFVREGSAQIGSSAEGSVFQTVVLNPTSTNSYDKLSGRLWESLGIAGYGYEYVFSIGGSVSMGVAGKDAELTIANARVRSNISSSMYVGGLDGNGTLNVTHGSVLDNLTSGGIHLLIGAVSCDSENFYGAHVHHTAVDSSGKTGYSGNYTTMSDGKSRIGRGVVNVLGQSLVRASSNGIILGEGELNIEGGSSVYCGYSGGSHANDIPTKGTGQWDEHETSIAGAEHATALVNIKSGSKFSTGVGLKIASFDGADATINIDGEGSLLEQQGATKTYVGYKFDYSGTNNNQYMGYNYSWNVKKGESGAADSQTRLNITNGGKAVLHEVYLGNSYGKAEVVLNISGAGSALLADKMEVYQGTVINNAATLSAGGTIHLYGGTLNMEGEHAALNATQLIIAADATLAALEKATTVSAQDISSGAPPLCSVEMNADLSLQKGAVLTLNNSYIDLCHNDLYCEAGLTLNLPAVQRLQDVTLFTNLGSFNGLTQDVEVEAAAYFDTMPQEYQDAYLIYNASQGTLTLSAVPEPTTATLSLLALAALAARRRRR